MNRLITILFLGMTAIIMQAKTDKEQIEALYREMYEAMVAKDTVMLNRVHADDFVLIHMTGMRQSKAEYIRAIADGTLNYYSVEHEEMDIAIKGNTATLTGKSRVTAAVFGSCSKTTAKKGCHCHSKETFYHSTSAIQAKAWIADYL